MFPSVRGCADAIFGRGSSSSRPAAAGLRTGARGRQQPQIVKLGFLGGEVRDAGLTVLAHTAQRWLDSLARDPGLFKKVVDLLEASKRTGRLTSFRVPPDIANVTA
jgi:hypothetical protein